MKGPLLNFGEPINWANPLNRGLVSRWQVFPGYGGGGVQARDLVRKSGNHGTLTSMAAPFTSTSGAGSTTRIGGFGEWRFDGTDDNINAGTSSSLGMQAHTVLASVYMTATSNDQPLISREEILSDGWEWYVRNIGASKMSYAYYDGGVRGFYIATGTIPTNAWTRLCGVWRQTDGKVDFYYNGKLDSTVTTTTGTIVNAASRICYIARRGSAAASQRFSGAMDNIQVIARPFSATEAYQDFVNSQRLDDPTLNWIVPKVYSFPTAAAAASSLLLRRRRMAAVA